MNKFIKLKEKKYRLIVKDEYNYEFSWNKKNNLHEKRQSSSLKKMWVLRGGGLSPVRC